MFDIVQISLVFLKKDYLHYRLIDTFFNEILYRSLCDKIDCHYKILLRNSN